MKTTYKRILWVVGSLLLLGVVGFVIFITSLHLGYDDSEENELKFDKNTWVHFKTKNDDNVRHYMLTDLKNNYLKIGTDSIYVKTLLGEPDTRRFGFAYNMGIYDSPFDPTFLIIEFDKNGKLLRTSIQTI